MAVHPETGGEEAAAESGQQGAPVRRGHSREDPARRDRRLRRPAPLRRRTRRPSRPQPADRPARLRRAPHQDRRRSMHRYFVDGGFAQVRDDVVTVLTNRALAADAIDPASAAREPRESPGNAGFDRSRPGREAEGHGPRQGHDPRRPAQELRPARSPSFTSDSSRRFEPLKPPW